MTSRHLRRVGVPFLKIVANLSDPTILRLKAHQILPVVKFLSKRNANKFLVGRESRELYNLIVGRGAS